MKILVVAAHPDDEILGLGGTLAKHTLGGDEVYSCILCENVTARSNKPKHEKFLKQVHAAAKIVGIIDSLFFDFPNIKMNTVPTLNIVQSIEEAIMKFRPEIVYTHYTEDLNDDHRIVSNATMVAIRLPERQNVKGLPMNMIHEVLFYEVPSATEWSLTDVFKPNIFVNIENTFKTKIEALREYSDIIKKHPHPRSIENLTALANYRGAQAGYNLAEAFILVRGIR